MQIVILQTAILMWNCNRDQKFIQPTPQITKKYPQLTQLLIKFGCSIVFNRRISGRLCGFDLAN